VIREEDSHRAFRALLEAMAHPGRWMATPARDASVAVELLTFAAWDGDPYVTFADSDNAATALADAHPGTEDEPELSTTLVLTCDDAPTTEVSIGGPGIRERFVTSIPIDLPAIRIRRDLCAHFPRGVDLVFIDRDGRVMGLPRTSVVQERA
jgi:alpha-D-ribose 1-methylphosphonate 5-triphosphate synthase subunit PhnH